MTTVAFGLEFYEVKMIDSNTGSIVYDFTPHEILAMKYEMVLNDVGVCVLTIKYDREVWDLFQLDNFLEVYYSPTGTNEMYKEDTYLLRDRHVYYEEGIQQIAFTGLSLNHLLQRRVVRPTNDDNLNAGGFSTKAGPVNEMLRDYAYEQMVAPDESTRAIPNLSIVYELGSEAVGARLRYENLLEVFQEYAETGNTDFQIVRTEGVNLELRIGLVGEDKTWTTNYPLTQPSIVFNLDRGSLIDPSIKIQRSKELNMIYVLGEGEGVNQYQLQLLGGQYRASPFNLIEHVETVSKGKDETLTQGEIAYNIGINKLYESTKNITFTFTVPQYLPTMAYKDVWDFGDIITGEYSGLREDFRIEKITVNVQQGDSERQVEVRQYVRTR